MDRGADARVGDTGLLTVGSCFSGIGGIELGLEATGGFVTRWQIESDLYASGVLAKHWPDVARFGDIKTTNRKRLEKVDLVCGGFPCQDISDAGKRAGITGERSGLWRELLRTIRMVRPKIALVENVAALLHRGMGTVLGDLAESGYDAEWDCVSACEFGAPHPRDRVFIVANPKGKRSGQLRWEWSKEDREATRNLYWPTNEPGCERVVDGIPNRMDRLKCLGNAVVPQVAQKVGEMILAHEARSVQRGAT